MVLLENGQKFFWVGGFSLGSVGLQETTILFCPALQKIWDFFLEFIMNGIPLDPRGGTQVEKTDTR